MGDFKPLARVFQGFGCPRALAQRAKDFGHARREAPRVHCTAGPTDLPRTVGWSGFGWRSGRRPNCGTHLRGSRHPRGRLLSRPRDLAGLIALAGRLETKSGASAEGAADPKVAMATAARAKTADTLGGGSRRQDTIGVAARKWAGEVTFMGQKGPRGIGASGLGWMGEEMFDGIAA